MVLLYTVVEDSNYHQDSIWELAPSRTESQWFYDQAILRGSLFVFSYLRKDAGRKILFGRNS